MKKKIIIVLIIMLLPTFTFAQECCSTHAGISKCSDSGYYICNDGTKSECTCIKEEVTTTKEVKVQETNKISIYDRENLMYISLALVLAFMLLCITSHKK